MRLNGLKYGYNLRRVRIGVRNLNRKYQFSVKVDPAQPPSVVKAPNGKGAPVFLHWDQAIDDEQYLRRCPVCRCRELFSRKSFPQVTGFWIVVLAAAVASVLFGFREVVWAFVVFGAVVLIDAVIYLFARRCLVCYRCRSEFRDVAIRQGHPSWDLAVGEKYRTTAEDD